MTDHADPRLTWSDDGTPISGRFGDVYFSREDGLAESRAVFLGGCGLPDAWTGRPRFVVAELGFGTGLNVAALIDLWRRHAPPGGHLHVFSVERFPLGRDQARRALSAWPELHDVAAALASAWPAQTPGFHRLDLPPEWRVTLDLSIGDVVSSLDRWDGAADAWFLDGFAPATNPEMWSDDVMRLVAARSAPGARVATFTVAGAVRRGLAAVGFDVRKAPGHGRKRERLEAVAPGRPQTAAPGSVAVVGAGVAGQATARALAALGAGCKVFEAKAPGAGASGFPAALVTPRLDAGDQRLAELYAQALHRARALYDETPDAVIAPGVLQLEQAPRDARRFEVVARQPFWPGEDMTPRMPDDCADWAGEPVQAGGLRMASALTVDPAAVRRSWLDDVSIVGQTVSGVAPDGARLRLTFTDGSTSEAFDAVVITAGWGTADLMPVLDLAPVRGQADWAIGVQGSAVAWGGYAAPTRDGVLFGATHDRGRADSDLSDEASRRNLATLAERLPGLAARVAAAPSGRRTAVRATTRDRLPVAGAVAPGLFVLGGLGSRGFCMAPLLGEHVAALAVGAPSPMPRDLAARVGPARLTERVAQADRSPERRRSGEDE